MRAVQRSRLRGLVRVARCSEATLLGRHRDSPRGEGIGGVICIGATMLGRTAYSRLARDDKPWSA